MPQLSSHVILVHGLGRRPTSLRRIAQVLRAQGYPVTNWAYRSRTQTLNEAAHQLAAAYATVAQTTTTVHFVTHSMGGIVLRRLLAQTALPQLGKTVMLAPPNNGSLVARRVLRNPVVTAVLGPAAHELADGTALNASCAVLTTPVLVIAGTNAHDIRNPVCLLSAAVLHEPSDGTVAVRETTLPRMDRFVEVAACHTWIMNHPHTLREISAFFQG
jgi:triacylglycerol lipase